jgi:hypothetical protein
MIEVDIFDHDGIYIGTMIYGRKYPGSNYTVIRTVRIAPNEWEVIAGRGKYFDSPDPRKRGYDVMWASYVHAAKLSLHAAIFAARDLAVEWGLKC